MNVFHGAMRYSRANEDKRMEQIRAADISRKYDDSEDVMEYFDMLKAVMEEPSRRWHQELPASD